MTQAVAVAEAREQPERAEVLEPQPVAQAAQAGPRQEALPEASAVAPVRAGVVARPAAWEEAPEQAAAAAHRAGQRAPAVARRVARRAPVA